MSAFEIVKGYVDKPSGTKFDAMVNSMIERNDTGMISTISSVLAAFRYLKDKPLRKGDEYFRPGKRMHQRFSSISELYFRNCWIKFYYEQSVVSPSLTNARMLVRTLKFYLGEQRLKHLEKNIRRINLVCFYHSRILGSFYHTSERTQHGN